MPRSDNFEGCIEVLAPSGGVVAGTMYRIGNTLGLAMTTADAGAKFVFKVAGRVAAAPKLNTTGNSFAAGAMPYWDATNKRFTAVSSGNKDHGVIVAEPAASTAATVDVILTGKPAA
jgi:predicted RecA/RadA family phage recombinase